MRIIEFIVCLIMIVVLMPLIGIVGILIKISSKGPILHISKRVGRDNVIYKMPKFRTMKIDTPQLATHLIDPKSFVTPVGKFLRKTSIDELPQLFSVIIGDMSLVGPRPALFNQCDLIEMRTKMGIHKLRPGITGWAQINGRDEISIEQKVELDYEYLQKKSIVFDLKIIFLTLSKVILAKNIAQ